MTIYQSVFMKFTKVLRSIENKLWLKLPQNKFKIQKTYIVKTIADCVRCSDLDAGTLYTKCCSAKYPVVSTTNLKGIYTCVQLGVSHLHRQTNRDPPLVAPLHCGPPGLVFREKTFFSRIFAEIRLIFPAKSRVNQWYN